MDDMEKTVILEDQQPETESDFTPITSQEQLDAVLKKRLDRQKSKLEREFEERLRAATQDATSEEIEALKAKTAEQDELLQLAKKENDALREDKAKRDIKDLKLYNAQQYGLPIELLDNITGTTPDEIEKSAQTLAAHIRRSNPEPMFNPEPSGREPKRSTSEAARSMLHELQLGKNDLF